MLTIGNHNIEFKSSFRFKNRRWLKRSQIPNMQNIFLKKFDQKQSEAKILKKLILRVLQAIKFKNEH